MGSTNFMELRNSMKIIDLSTWEKQDDCKIGVHGSNWIYQFRRSCPQTTQDAELAKQFMSRVSYLRRCGFTPYIVFDGDELPVKKTTYSKGKSQQTKDLPDVGVTHETVYSLIQILKRDKVEFVVAPFKADAQLAFLNFKKHVDVILTTDADLILYGCEKIIFDYEKEYYEYDFSRLQHYTKFRPFTKETLLQAYMLGGCNYLPNIPGVTLVIAIDIMKKKKRTQMMTCESDYLEILDACKWIRADKASKLEYIERFCNATKTYKHQRVYDPTNKTVVCLKDFQNLTADDEPHIGPLGLLPDIAEDIANGSIHPITKYQMKDIPDTNSQVNLLGEDELIKHCGMERLFRATVALKVLHEAMFNMVQDHFITLLRQISKESKVSKAFQQLEAESHNSLALFGVMSIQKINKLEEYKYKLEKVIGRLNDLIDDKSLQTVLYGAELYCQRRKKAENEVDEGKWENLKKEFQMSYDATHKALSSAVQDQTEKTKEILVDMCKLESLHCGNLVPILESIYKGLTSDSTGNLT